MDLAIGVTGASGARYAVRLLQALGEAGVTRHVVFSAWGYENLALEMGLSSEDADGLSDILYDELDMAAALSSGSFPIDGVIVEPCSMKTLSAVANGYADNLIARMCDVAIKEGRPLVLCPRETPLSAIHLENMLKLARLGVSIVPPMPSFYLRPSSIDDLVEQHVMRVLDRFKIPFEEGRRWKTD